MTLSCLLFWLYLLCLEGGSCRFEVYIRVRLLFAFLHADTLPTNSHYCYLSSFYYIPDIR